MNNAGRFTKRPVTIDAVQYTRRFAWPDWFHDAVTRNDIIVFGTSKWTGPTEPCYCEIKTLEGTMRADENDWIIRGIKGEIYPCKSDIFEASYIAELEARTPAATDVLDTKEEWRRLALQYDGHRMQALSHLRMLLNDFDAHGPIVSQFLAAPPSSTPAAPVVAEGMPVSQEPKYGICDNRLYNRESGEFIPLDEPVFIFRARDVKAKKHIANYADDCKPVSIEHYRAVALRVGDFSLFGLKHPERMKEPDTVLAAHPVAGSPVPIDGLGSMTNEDDGVLTLRFKDEDAAQAFMQNYAPTVDCRDMPDVAGSPAEASEKVGGLRLDTIPFERGEQAFKNGEARDACPYNGNDIRVEWWAGYDYAAAQGAQFTQPEYSDWTGEVFQELMALSVSFRQRGYISIADELHEIANRPTPAAAEPIPASEAPIGDDPEFVELARSYRKSPTGATYRAMCAYIDNRTAAPVPASEAASEIMAAIDRAKKLHVWNKVPHVLHIELDTVFKLVDTLAAPAAPTDAKVDELHNFIVQNRDSVMSMFEYRTTVKAMISKLQAAQSVRDAAQSTTYRDNKKP